MILLKPETGIGKSASNQIGWQQVVFTIAEIKSRISHEGDKYVDWRKIT